MCHLLARLRPASEYSRAVRPRTLRVMLQGAMKGSQTAASLRRVHNSRRSGTAPAPGCAAPQRDCGERRDRGQLQGAGVCGGAG
jgi:hypothetical protein